jgi:uncharacterized membrane protein YkgB
MKERVLTYLMRLGIFLIFVGHGAVAWNAPAHWAGYLRTVGFSEEHAYALLPCIGVIDIIVGIITLLYPLKIVILYATIWAFATAIVRPLSGEEIWSFIERGGNWILPLILLITLYSKQREKRST